jgi:hypothetical protein
VEDHRRLQSDALEVEAEAQRRLLAGDEAGAAEPLREAAGLYRASWEAAPPGGYGRLIGLLKVSILAGDGPDAAAYALDELDREAPSPTAAYALALAALAAGDDDLAATAAGEMAGGGEAFERTAAAIAALAAGDAEAYAPALRAIVDDFEERDAHLTGVAIADTALVLERLAEDRGLAAHPGSPLLPP